MPIRKLLAQYPDNKTMTQEDLAEITGKSVDTIKRLRYTGRGPRYLRIGQTCRYLKSDVEAWLESLIEQAA